MGAGPMTGRAAGYCAGAGVPGFTNTGFGRGYGMGFGRGGGGGRGFGRGFGRGAGAGFGRGLGYPVAGTVAPPTSDQELAILKQQAEQLNADRSLIQSRIQELESKPEEG
jgi:hypothetical protein